ncbi:MAG: choice-of-anchor B family protein [Bacteroidia bacterium]
MKRINLCLVFFFAIIINANAQYQHENISLVGHWYNPTQAAEPSLGIKYQGVWGWVDTTDNNKEYAIIGSSSGTNIIDISNPTNPVLVDYVAGKRDQCIWREYKTYGHYLYAISDDPSPNSFQIIDLSYLPDSVHVIHDTTSIFERAHTLYVDGNRLYCASVTKGNFQHYSMAVYSLDNPAQPQLLRTLNQDDSLISAVHDMFVRNDTVYASCGYQGLFIYKFNPDTTFSLISSYTSYPDQGYNHSSFLTPNGKSLVFCDEVPRNLPVKVIDVTDLQNISLESSFRSADGPTPHNPYIIGSHRVVIAYYQDGVQIYDIKNPSTPFRMGYFDTDTLDGPHNNYNPNGTPYHGCWGAYVDLPSGLILASDMQNGLFVLDATLALNIKNKEQENVLVSLFPNPAESIINVDFNISTTDLITIEIYDVTGRKLFAKQVKATVGSNTQQLLVSQLKAGVYIIKGGSNDFYFSKRFVKK